jgi:S-DNA-T family DNA segregation ATPase FtsK/SpoIIIE
MAKHRQTTKRKESVLHLEVVKKHALQGVFVLFNCFAALVMLALLTYAMPDFNNHSQIWHNSAGVVGTNVANHLFSWFGYMAYLVPFGIVVIAIHMLFDRHRVFEMHWALLLVRFCGLLLFISGGCGLCNILVTEKWVNYAPGGTLGFSMLHFFWQGFEGPGTLIILIAIMGLGLTWLLGVSWMEVLELFGQACFYLTRQLLKASLWTIAYYQRYREQQQHRQWPQQTEMPKVLLTETIKKVARPKAIKNEIEQAPIAVVKPAPVEKEAKAISSPHVQEGLPELNLLQFSTKRKANTGYTAMELEQLSRHLEQHLMDFAVQAQVVAVHPGPVITRFELQLGAGTKVSKLSGLAKDLARALSVNRVRVVEVIPGKSVVGLELPNPDRVTVKLGEVLASDVYQQAHSVLTLALGVDIAGHPMVVDLAKMPHLLVAGTTGSGKSVGINSMILSLLFKSTPEQVRLILIDPKMLELSVYDGIPHLLTPVVTDMREAASSLRWCVSEMERRYRLMSGFGVRNIAGFNEKVKQAILDGQPLTDPTIDPLVADVPAILEPLPFIVVVIDELADMMMVVGKKVEQLIARIAQKARAAGIHLILATQRPSVDVLTGLIKSNIPTRISFQVSSKIDSRTILDQQGAEQLLGNGDMLYLAPGTGAPLRVHGAYVEDQEVHRVAEDWRGRGAPNYIEAITQMSVDFNEGGTEEGEGGSEDSDPLYDQVVEFVVQNRKASISSVQRRFKIGYNRSARLVEEMERVGILGPMEGGMREVLIPPQDN